MNWIQIQVSWVQVGASVVCGLVFTLLLLVYMHMEMRALDREREKKENLMRSGKIEVIEEALDRDGWGK